MCDTSSRLPAPEVVVVTEAKCRMDLASNQLSLVYVQNTMIDEWHDNNSNALTSYSRRKIETRVLSKQRDVTAPTPSHSVQFCTHNAGFIQMVLSPPDFFRSKLGCKMRFTPVIYWTVCVQDSVKKSDNHMTTIFICTWPRYNRATCKFTFLCRGEWIWNHWKTTTKYLF